MSLDRNEMLVLQHILSYHWKDYFPVPSNLCVSFIYVFFAEVVEILEPIVEIYNDHLLWCNNGDKPGKTQKQVRFFLAVYM